MSRTVAECEYCDFHFVDAEKTYVCRRCGYVLTAKDKEKLLAESNAIGRNGCELSKPQMKYYEFDYPYYALIRAENEQSAKEKYTEVVCDEDPDNPLMITEVSRDYALITYSRIKNEDGELISVNEAVEEFNDPESGDVLLVDGTLQ